MSDKIYFRPAIPLLISMICGIVIGSDFSGYEIWAAASAIICAGFSCLNVFRKKSVLISPVLLFVSLGYLSIQPWVSPRLADNHIIHYADTHSWVITGRIATQPRRIDDRTRFHLLAISLGGDGQTSMVGGKLRVTAVGVVPFLAVGDTVRFTSRIRPLASFKNSGGFDYRRYMAYKGILASAYAKGNKLVVIDKNAVGGFRQIIDSARSTFAGLVEKSGFTSAQGIFKALIIGDRSQISPETRQDFNRAGVGHLLAISGLHIGIVATVAFGFFHHLTAMIKAFLWRAWTRKAAALLSLLPVLAYGMIAGLSPSTQRAVIMVSLFLMTFLFEREQDPLNTLALAALVILIADPPSFFSISFQLSFTAVLAIVYGFSRLRNFAVVLMAGLKDSWRLRFVRWLVSFFLVSFFAICGSLPLVAYYFNQISLVGLGANFVVVPLVGFITIPLGLLALFLSPLSTKLAFWFIEAGCGILTYALEVVQFFADLPFAAVETFTPSLLEIGCFYFLGWALLNLSRNPSKGAAVPHSTAVAAIKLVPANLEGPLAGNNSRFKRFMNILLKRNSQINLARAALALVLIIMTGDACYWMYQRFWHSDLRITVIDVGHGSSSLLEFPGGFTMLIDGGGFADNSAFDVGKNIVAPLLYGKKIRSVDTLIISHPNSDHLNGLIYIAGHFHVKRVWTNSEARTTLGYKTLMEIIANKEIVLPAFENISRHHRINGVALDFLYPPQDFLLRKQKEKWRNINNNSLVVKVSLGATSFLFPGDIMADAERELVGIAGRKLNSTVLIAPHHGSRSSSSGAFLSEVDPEVVVVSSGRQSRFNLPNPAVLKKYQHLGCKIFRTDINGAVFLSTDGRQLEIEPYIVF